MLKFSFLFACFLFMTASVFAQIPLSEADFRAFDKAGNPVNLSNIIDAAKDTDVVFLGENHDDAVAHALQLEIFKQVFAKYGAQKNVGLSLEMFERDVQIVIDEYLADLIPEKQFLANSRPWNSYATDYKPLFEFAKQNKLSVIAANAPRRYVNRVSRLGRDSLDALSPTAKSFLAPLPFGKASEAYTAKFTALMGGMPGANHGENKMLDAQSLWDATMAFAMAEHLKKTKNSMLVQLNGAFHSENRLGTTEHLQKYLPKVKFVVVTMRYDESFPNFDKAKHSNLGDFVIITNPKIPRTGKIVS